MKKKIAFALIAIAAVVMVYTYCNRISDYNGIDISHHNDINWATIAKKSNIKFVYIKATEGASYVDNKFLENVKNANRINLHVGAYHYFKTDVTGIQQFENFSKILDQAKFDLIPVIDVEKKGNNFSNKERVQKELKTLIDLLTKKYGKKPIVYLGNFVPQVLSVTYHCPFWIRTMEFSNLVPKVTIKQIGYANIGVGGTQIDADYCYDIKNIMLK